MRGLVTSICLKFKSCMCTVSHGLSTSQRRVTSRMRLYRHDALLILHRPEQPTKPCHQPLPEACRRFESRRGSHMHSLKFAKITSSVLQGTSCILFPRFTDLEQNLCACF